MLEHIIVTKKGQVILGTRYITVYIILTFQLNGIWATRATASAPVSIRAGMRFDFSSTDTVESNVWISSFLS